MTPSALRDLLVGLFVIVGLCAVAYMSVVLGGVSYGREEAIRLVATFNEIGGLGPRSQVVIGGLKVGQIESIELDEDFLPRVTFRVNSGLLLPDDTSASILTAGVLGDQYIALEPGGSDTFLSDGDEIAFTQGALVLERLIGKLVQNLGGGN